MRSNLSTVLVFGSVPILWHAMLQRVKSPHRYFRYICLVHISFVLNRRHTVIVHKTHKGPQGHDHRSVFFLVFHTLIPRETMSIVTIAPIATAFDMVIAGWLRWFCFLGCFSTRGMTSSNLVVVGIWHFMILKRQSLGMMGSIFQVLYWVFDPTQTIPRPFRGDRSRARARASQFVHMERIHLPPGIRAS